MLIDFVGFLILGGLLIIVVIIYIVGNWFYGYIGLGDIFVLVFFGWLSVMGNWYFQVYMLILVLIFLVIVCGLLVMVVLNINNLCDINSDRENGKNIFVV